MKSGFDQGVMEFAAFEKRNERVARVVSTVVTVQILPTTLQNGGRLETKGRGRHTT